MLSLDGLGAVCAVSARYPGRWLTNGPRKSRVETLAIAFGVASPVDLTAIASRVHARFQMQSTDWQLPLFTKPLVRRLKIDPEATKSLQAA